MDENHLYFFIILANKVACLLAYGVDKSSTNLPGWGGGHLCRVADNTV